MQESRMVLEILIGVCVPLAISVLVYAGLARKVYNLQMDLATLQEQFLRERNQRAALHRSKDKESLELLKDLKNQTPVPTPINPLRKFGIGA